MRTIEKRQYSTGIIQYYEVDDQGNVIARITTQEVDEVINSDDVIVYEVKMNNPRRAKYIVVNYFEDDIVTKVTFEALAEVKKYFLTAPAVDTNDKQYLGSVISNNAGYRLVKCNSLCEFTVDNDFDAPTIVKEAKSVCRFIQRTGTKSSHSPKPYHLIIGYWGEKGKQVTMTHNATNPFTAENSLAKYVKGIRNKGYQIAFMALKPIDSEQLCWYISGDNVKEREYYVDGKKVDPVLWRTTYLQQGQNSNTSNYPIHIAYSYQLTDEDDDPTTITRGYNSVGMAYGHFQHWLKKCDGRRFNGCYIEDEDGQTIYSISDNFGEQFLIDGKEVDKHTWLIHYNCTVSGHDSDGKPIRTPKLPRVSKPAKTVELFKVAKVINRRKWLGYRKVTSKDAMESQLITFSRAKKLVESGRAVLFEHDLPEYRFQRDSLGKRYFAFVRYKVHTAIGYDFYEDFKGFDLHKDALDFLRGKDIEYGARIENAQGEVIRTFQYKSKKAKTKLKEDEYFIEIVGKGQKKITLYKDGAIPEMIKRCKSRKEALEEVWKLQHTGVPPEELDISGYSLKEIKE